jgi:hypothetical protein
MTQVGATAGEHEHRHDREPQHGQRVVPDLQHAVSDIPHHHRERSPAGLPRLAQHVHGSHRNPSSILAMPVAPWVAARGWR